MTQKSKEGRNVPNLRFPGFEGEWKKKPLGKISRMKAGKFVRANDIIEEINDGLYPCYGGNGLRGYTSSFTHYGKYSLIGRQGALCGNVNLVNGKFQATEHAVVVDHNEEFNTDFLFYVLNNLNLNRYATGQAQPGLSVSSIERITFSFPLLPEQIKIANFLSAIDNLIQTQSKIIEDYKTLKKGMMQKIFKQEIRFKDEGRKEFPKWKEMKLKEILNYEQPTKYLVSNTEYDESYKIPVLTAGKTFLLGYTNEQNGIFEDKLPTIIFDDFTTAFQYVDFPFKAKSSAMKMLISKDNEVNIKFIFEAMKTIKFPLAEHKRYWISEYQNEKIPYPCRGEQQKIAATISAIDKKIALEENYLSKLSAQKKYLLQNLFI
ncbi:restriction endonuclease subunit S [Galbibacter mesophilus]|uniref:restriction endonuclease subunit S n=1 Tax=Galbibacter mesophilus TaxID=379069 RepID=UPI00191D906F|nr:restriction endonuclease subunit S [Galbibacter mesophilus]MCM5661822.1 restriction endonuclease subunit S [Galbibacter mesophilus]